MNALAKYFRLNFMEVMGFKSKVVVFRRGGLIRRGIRFCLEDTEIEIIHEYSYHCFERFSIRQIEPRLPFRSTDDFEIRCGYITLKKVCPFSLKRDWVILSAV